MSLECDYLIVGTGAAGMAFADAIVSESTDRTIIMIDKLPNPGGHWNHAYEFVRLHQPACYYGVASEELERAGETALYKYEDLSNRQELLDYYQFVMDKMVKTGRVRHFGECTYNGTGLSMDLGLNEEARHSFIDKEGICHNVQVKRRLVDATFTKVTVPRTNPPRYKVEPGVNCIPINNIYGLVGLQNAENSNKINENKTDELEYKEKKFVVVGAGKTGIDAVLYLLDNGIDQSNITWVMPRDAWMLNRDFFDPQTIMLKLRHFFDEEDTLERSLLRKEEVGVYYRLDKDVWPEKYSCATVEDGELEKLRSIRNVIRQGRVLSITKTHLILKGNNELEDNEGQKPVLIPYSEGSVVVDCSSNALPKRPAVPIFQSGKKIILQPALQCVICISAAMTGYIECHPDFADDDDRNSVIIPAPYPTSTRDGLRTLLLEIHNTFVGFGADPRTRDWFNSCRLNITSHTSSQTFIKVLLTGELPRFLGALSNFIKALKEQYRHEFGGVEYEYETKLPDSLKQSRTILFVVMFGFYAVLFFLFIVLLLYVWPRYS